MYRILPDNFSGQLPPPEGKGTVHTSFLEYKNNIFGIKIKGKDFFVFKISAQNGQPVKQSLFKNEKQVQRSALVSGSQCNICQNQFKTPEELYPHILKFHKVFEIYQIQLNSGEQIVTCPETICDKKNRYFQLNGALAYKKHRFFQCKNKGQNSFHFLSQIKLLKTSHQNINKVEQKNQQILKK